MSSSSIAGKLSGLVRGMIGIRRQFNLVWKFWRTDEFIAIKQDLKRIKSFIIG